MQKSKRADKKFDAVLSTPDGRQRTVSFGAAGYSDYTQYKDPERKRAYEARHKATEDWSDPTTAGFWAKHLLWNKPSLKASAADIASKFRMRVALK